MEADPVFLSRVQFAFTIGFHILFPTLTIGLAVLLAIIEGFWLKTGDVLYRQAYKFWSKLFALSFGMGVVTGVVLSYEIGTNFGPWSRITGNILGPIMSYEVLTAFFLEAGFLGIVLFGWNRVRPGVHYFATLMVAIGTVLSAFWILSANSWMQTPDGFRYEDGVFYIASWWEAIFNPSFPYRLAHMLTAAFLTTTFFTAAVAAWYLLRDYHVAFARRTLKYAVLAAAMLAPTQILIGDLHGLNTLHHQPIKVAAMEAHWETSGDVPFVLFAIPDQQAAENRFELAVPYAGSLVLTHSLHGEVKGLKEVPPDERPPVAMVFFAFRIMLAIGFSMLAVAWFGAWLMYKGRLYDTRWYQRLLLCFGPLGFVAVIAGWITTETGRQPWTVHGLLRTADSVSPLVTGGQVAFTLAMFIVVYLVLFMAFLWFLFHVIRGGPEPGEDEPDPGLPHQQEGRPAIMVGE